MRIPDRRRDSPYFNRLQQKLPALPGIEAVEVNPLTASLLLRHTLSTEAIVEFAETQGLFEAAPGVSQPVTLAEHISNKLQSIDREIHALTRGTIDLWSLLFLVLVGMGVGQISKGNVAAPATTLLWYAMGSLFMRQSKQGSI